MAFLDRTIPSFVSKEKWIFERRAAVLGMTASDSEMAHHLDHFFDLWHQEKGYFNSSIPHLHLYFDIEAVRLLKEVEIFRKNGTTMPKKLQLTITERENWPGMIAVIQNLASLVEELEISVEYEDDKGKSNALQEFFATPICWPFRQKLKDLHVHLKMQKSELHQLPANILLPFSPVARRSNLRSFTITFDISALLCTDSMETIEVVRYIPAISQIARAMTTYGGTGCGYYLHVDRAGHPYYVESKALTSMLRREMLEIWKADKSVEWKQLEPHQRI
ncbi:uncharacterized protein L201_005902 [Kwoniella dendrophila CBS 6074]|uniref:Uncharacterized protein n=1 Tax=Kwoniella dendrophila CBS 6074 TaxID=1295534 RepID=A0AAX4K1B5_9TREE